MQLEGMRRLLLGNSEKKLLVVQSTGQGKSTIIKLLGLMLKGVHLIVHPLLVPDQVASFMRCSDKYRTVLVVNLDELCFVF